MPFLFGMWRHFLTTLIFPAMFGFWTANPGTAAHAKDIRIEDSRCGAVPLETVDRAFSFARTSLSGEKTGPFPEQKRPCMLFLSVSDGNSPAVTAIGSGESLKISLEEAVETIRRHGRPDPPRWIKLDFVDVVKPAEGKGTKQSPFEAERSLWGLAADRSGKQALLPEELVGRSLVNSKQTLRSDNLRRFFDRFPHRAEKMESSEGVDWKYRFSTIGYFSGGGNPMRLYRGHRSHYGLSAPDLLEAAEAGGRYLTEAVDERGRFVYSYLPKSNRVKDRYNILRHAGAVFAMLQLYGLTRRPELGAAAERALEHLLWHCLPCSGDTRCVVERGNVKLGGNALAVLALVERMRVRGDRLHLPAAQALAGWIVSMQEESGAFMVHKMSYLDGEGSDFRSVYYPGEAVFALARLYGLDTDPLWLNAAKRNARYLIEVRDGSLETENLPHDHWLLYGLRELQRFDPDPIWETHGLRIAESILNAQNREPEYPDWLGSFYRPPRSTPTATRTEALGAAYGLAAVTNRAFAEEVLKGYCRGVRFLLQTRFLPESAMYLDDPRRVLGGFHRSLTDYELRIDTTQHAISSLVGLYAILKKGGRHGERGRW